MGVERRWLVTGGAGFIGSEFVRRLLARDDDLEVTVLDKLTYAGNIANLDPVASDPRYAFVRGDINDAALVDAIVSETDTIVNFAAESHVDRSIQSPDAFIETDVHGTFCLLEAARRHGVSKFIQVSTDEVYGEVPTGASTESDPLRPRSPYAASKAAGDLLTLAYATTYGVAACVTRGSNTFGPYQYPEKLIPLFVTNAIDDLPLPIYGDGQQVRDWISVADHCAAIEFIADRGSPGEVYNVAGGRSATNLEVTTRILALTGKPSALIRYVQDRPGHDRRYALDRTKLRGLGWEPTRDFDEALSETVRWYVTHPEWWRPLKTGEYLDYYRRQYESRLADSMAGP